MGTRWAQASSAPPLAENSLDAAPLRALEGMHALGRLGESSGNAEMVPIPATPLFDLLSGKSGLYRKITMNRFDCCPAPDLSHDLRPVEGPEADDELASLAKAIGHPIRVKILRILAHRDSCICSDIVDELPLAQSTVSQHLKVLKNAGLIRGEVDGPRVCYCIEPRNLRRFKALLGGL